MRKHRFLFTTSAISLLAFLPALSVASETDNTLSSRAAVSQLPFGSVVIEREQIERSSARNVIDVVDSAGGITLQRFYGLNEGGAMANVFGKNGSQPLILLNGRRFTDTSNIAAKLSTIPLDGVERVEVSPAGGGVLYGQGNMAGAVNIVTRQGNEEAGSIRLEAGSYATRNGHIWASTKRGNTGLFSAASLYHHDGYRDNNSLRRHDGYIDVHHQLNDATLYLTFQGSNEELDLPGTTQNDNSVRKQAINNADLNKNNSYRLLPGAVWHFDKMDAALEGSVFDNKDETYVGGNYYEYNTDGYSISPRLSGQVETGSFQHHWTLGGDLYHTRYHQEDTINNANDRAKQDQIGYYGQLNTQITPWLTSSIGARQDRVKQSLWNSHPVDSHHHYLEMYEGGLQFKLADPLSFSVSAARSAQAANLLETADANSRLAPQTGHVYSATLAWQEKSQSSSITYWYGDYKYGLYYDGSQFKNRLDRTLTSGFALNSKWDLDENVWLVLNASIEKSEYKEGPEKGNRVPNAPRRTGYAQFNWQPIDWLTVGLAHRYYGSRHFGNDDANQHGRQRSYNWNDATVTASWHNASLTLGLYNFQNRKVYDMGFLDSNNDEQTYPLHGRHFMGSISVKF